MPILNKKIFDKDMVLKEGEKYHHGSLLDKIKHIKLPFFSNAPKIEKDAVLGKPYRKPTGYNVLKMLGEGAFGKVFLVEDKKHPGERFALKRQAKQKIIKEQMQKMVFHEMLIMEHVSKKDNIVRLIDAMEDKENVHFLMELCGGGDVLQAVVRHFDEEGVFTEKVAADMVREMILAVKAVHDVGVVHRDLKPENFMYAKQADGSLKMKLGDYGLAAFLPGRGQAPLSQACGTPNFVAPEMWRSESYNEQVDVWSLGVCLAVLLTGRVPYDGQDLNALAVAANTPINFTILPWISLSEPLVDLIRRMLEIDPKKRITLAEALKHPWVIPGGAPDKTMDTRLKMAVSNCAKTNHLAKVACTALAMNATDADVEQMVENFQRLDLNNDGVLTLDELRLAISQGKAMAVRAEMLEQIFQFVDADNSGYIDIKEFAAGVMAMRMQTDERKVVEAFKLLDANGDGTISKDELMNALKKSKLPASVLESIIQEADKDGDGLISFEEFRGYWLQSLVQAETEVHVEEERRKSGASIGGNQC